MMNKISKSNDDWETIHARLAEVRMGGHARLRAEAQLARAEAVADALAALNSAVKRALKQAFSRPYHGPSTSIR
jgi:hypothetical protein